MDPLSLLRDFNLNQQLQDVQVLGEQVNFGTSYVFPKSSFTAFRGQKDYCTLEVVLHVLQTRSLSQPEYIRAAAAAKLNTLAYIDRKVRQPWG